MTNRDIFDHSRHGTVGELDDGRVLVAFERQLPHPIEKVWRAITDPAELASWFPGINIELTLGGEFQIWFGGGYEGPAEVSGSVLELDPPNLLQLGSMRYELTRTDSGCQLRFTDILHFDDKRSRQQFAVSVLGGWHAHLDRLSKVLDEIKVEDVPEPDYSVLDVPGWEVL
jgi:uncharacterized protein YndB with AHSA1/START domain